MSIIQSLIEEFPSQLARAIEIGENLKVTPHPHDIRHLVIAGLGGSGIGGSIVKAITADELPVPVDVLKSYEVPAYVGPHTLLIAASHSGNTEETLAVVEIALRRGAKIACATTGGRLYELALAEGLDVAKLPLEQNCPRQYLAYLLVNQLYFLMHYGLVGQHFRADLRAGLDRVVRDGAAIKTEAKLLAAHLFGKLPFIYADNNLGALATRFQQQINENAKQLAHVNIFPEMNHNELVGWHLPATTFAHSAVVYLRSSFNHPRVNVRMDVCRPIFAKLAQGIYDLELQGSSLAEQVLHFIHLTDWASLYLAELNQVDSFQIEVINHLKNELAKVK
jgi:glucose/mannose-6-phosphate isomerase